ncbi:YfhO family protein [Companilactobacillus allii]|uniref:Membrane protein 6-pyruvoyl-tetrahydropterin synthase-related domain-containing protein n=1 Tax=Companilactobacillus allii TaxID=1847728 RepID=A0A1P8Q3Y4_9LACO|nr:hypothetical protein [Companilactobacillus allii]APX72570.1 hypothetical protein BTM29_08410 [Companilactobacillus allii]USQ69671.1 YfhO family protein [Companilactobacillus allii]
MSNKVWKRTILGTTFILISIAYTFLLAIHGKANENLIFEVQHINSLKNIFSSPTNFNYWGHTGNLVSLFSPWLSLIVFLPLFQIGNTAISYLLAFGIVTLLTLISSYYFVNKLSDNTLQAFVFAVIYTFSITRLNLVFDNNFSDYLLMIFLPILFYGLFRIIEGFNADWPLYALGVALVGLTNPWMILSVFVISVIMIISAAIFKETHSVKYWFGISISILESFVAVLILTLGYTLPLIEHGFSQSSDSKSFIQVSKFNFSNYYDGSQNIYLIVAAITLVLCMVIIFRAKSYLIYKTASIGIIFSMILSSDIINWKIFGSFDLSRVTFYFWIIYSVLLCLMISYLLSEMVENKSSLFKLATLIFTVILSCTIFYMNFPKQNGDLFNTRIKSNESVTFHYSERNMKHKDDLKDFLINKKLERVQYTTTSNLFEFRYYNPATVTIDVPILAYKNANVQINNENVKFRETSRGTIQIRTKPGANIVQISYQYTVISRIAMLISVIGWILIMVLIINKGKWYIGKLSNNG